MHHQPEWVESELCHSHQELLELRWEVVSEGGDVEITDHQDQDHGKASGTSRGWEIPMGLFEESLSSLQKTRARNWEQGGRLPLIFPLWETLAAMFQADRRGTHTSFPLTQSLTCSSRHHVGLKLIHHPTRAWLIPPFVSRWTWRVRQDVVHGEMGSGLEHTTYVEGKSTF